MNIKAQSDSRKDTLMSARIGSFVPTFDLARLRASQGSANDLRGTSPAARPAASLPLQSKAARELPALRASPPAPAQSLVINLPFGFEVDAGRAALGFADSQAPASTDNASRPNFKVPSPESPLRPSFVAPPSGFSLQDLKIDPLAIFGSGPVASATPTANLRLGPRSSVTAQFPASLGLEGLRLQRMPDVTFTQGIGPTVVGATVPNGRLADFSAYVETPLMDIENSFVRFRTDGDPNGDPQSRTVSAEFGATF
jgi:hypothetical protein